MTESNRITYSASNNVTFCAGEMFSENLELTTFHELSHSLGIDREMYLKQQRAPFAEIENAVKKRCFHLDKKKERTSLSRMEIIETKNIKS